MASTPAAARCVESPPGVINCDNQPPNPENTHQVAREIHLLDGAIVRSVETTSGGLLTTNASSLVTIAIRAEASTLSLRGTLLAASPNGGQNVYIGNNSNLTIHQGALVETNGQPDPVFSGPTAVVSGGTGNRIRVDGTVRTTGNIDSGIWMGLSPAGLGARYFPTTIDIGSTGLVETQGTNSHGVRIGNNSAEPGVGTLNVAGTIRTTGPSSSAILYVNNSVINILAGANVESAQAPAIRGEGGTQITIAGRVARPSLADVAILLDPSQDLVTLHQSGRVAGIIDGRGGGDTLRLTGEGVTGPAITMGRTSGFTHLLVSGGSWIATNHDGTSAGRLVNNGLEIATATVAPGASLELRNDFADGPELAPRYVVNGTLVLNFTSSAADRQLNAPFGIQGTGGLLLTGPATVQLGSSFEDRLRYTGPTVVQNGALILRGNLAGDLATAAGTTATVRTEAGGGSMGALTNNGAFVWDQNFGGTIRGAATGSGSFTKNGTGVLNVLGRYGDLGATTINAGTLRLAGGVDPRIAFNVDAGTLEFAAAEQTIAGLAGGTGGRVGLTAGPLRVEQAGDSIFAGIVSGTGALTKAGAGRLTLSGTNTYSGATQVAGGTLRVTGSLASAVTTAGGRLEGGGTIGGYTGASGGVVAPGLGIGTLNVAGPVAFGSGSVFEVEADASGAADRIAATGAATLNGGTIRVLAAGGDYAPRTAYTILSAQGGVSGAFGNAASNLAFLTPVLSYQTNTVQLTLVRNDFSFATAAETPNERAAAAAAEALGFGNALHDAIVLLDQSQAVGAFNQLSGEIHASATSGLIEDSRYLREALLAGGGESAGPRAWAHTYGSWAETDADGNAAAFERDSSGAVLGIDLPLGGGWSAGVAGGYGRSTFESHGRGSAEADNVHAGARFGGRFGGFALSGGGAMTWHRIETARDVSFTGFSNSLAGDYDARTLQLFGEASYRAGLARFSLEPFANLAHVRVSTDAFSESGGAAALASDEREDEASFSTVGVRAEAALGAVALRGTLGWRHALSADPVAADHSFGTAAGFAATGVPIADDSVLVEAALQADFGAARLRVGYNGLIGGGSSDHGARATLSIGF